MYEEVLSYQKVIDGLQETIRSLTKIDDLSTRVKDVITAYEQLCSLAKVWSSDHYFAALFSYINIHDCVPVQTYSLVT